MKPLYKGITADELAEIRKEYHGKIIALKNGKINRIGRFYAKNGEEGFCVENLFSDMGQGIQSYHQSLYCETEIETINLAIENGCEVIWFDGRPSMIQYLEKKGMM